LILHPQRTPTRQPRINKNQEGLIGEEQATIQMVHRKGEVLLNGTKAMKPSLIDKSDKIPSGKYSNFVGKLGDHSQKQIKI
jgi:hypothetical protein